MKIDDSLKKAAANDIKQNKAANTETSKTGGSAKSQTTGGAGSAVNVNLSTQLQNVMEKMGDTTVFDAKKVDEIKAAISSGQFQIDTGKVADGLLKTVSELLQKTAEPK